MLGAQLLGPADRACDDLLGRGRQHRYRLRFASGSLLNARLRRLSNLVLFHPLGLLVAMKLELVHAAKLALLLDHLLEPGAVVWKSRGLALLCWQPLWFGAYLCFSWRAHLGRYLDALVGQLLEEFNWLGSTVNVASV